jgi:hypothetical protein
MPINAQEAAAVYVETSIPAGMSMSEYRSSRPRRASLRTRMAARLRLATR